MLKSGSEKKWFFSNFIVMLILSVFCSIYIGGGIINYIATIFCPKDYVEIEIVQSEHIKNGNLTEVWITGFSPSKHHSMEEIFLNAKQNTGFEYRRARDYGYNCDSIVNTAGDAGKLVLELPIKPETAIKFWPQHLSATIKITVGKESKILDLYCEEPNQTYTDYLYKGNNTVAILWILFYGVSYFTMIILFFLIFVFFTKIKLRFLNIKIEKKEQAFLFLIAVCAIFLYNYIVYPNSPQMNSDIGDAAWYWNSAFEKMSLRDFALNNYAKTQYARGSYISFRGYILPFFSRLTYQISCLLSLEDHTIWFLFSGVMHAFFWIYILPGIYNEITGKPVKLYHVLTISLLFSFFWRGYFIYPNSDFLACISMFLMIWMIIIFAKKGNNIFAILIGASAYIMVNSRVSYMAFLVELCIVILLIKLANSIACSKGKIFKVENLCYRFNLRSFSIIFLSFAVLGIPQMIINYYQGTISLLPYDYPGAWYWSDELHSIGSMNLSLFQLQDFPHTLHNKLGSNIVSSVFPDATQEFAPKMLTLLELIYLYAVKFREIISCIILKAFSAINIGTCYYYPPNGLFDGTAKIIFNFANYFVWIISVSILFSRKQNGHFLEKREKMMLIFIFLSIFLPYLILHIEWRYFLPVYTVVYYIFSFDLLNILSDNKKHCALLGKKIVSVIVLAICLYAISETVYANLYNYYAYTYR